MYPPQLPFISGKNKYKYSEESKVLKQNALKVKYHYQPLFREHLIFSKLRLNFSEHFFLDIRTKWTGAYEIAKSNATVLCRQDRTVTRSSPLIKMWNTTYFPLVAFHKSQ